MADIYPTSFSAVAAWAKTNGVTIAVARVRFAQYCVLRAIADSRTLSQMLAFKGGNALDFVWSPNRSTQDLDFSSFSDELTEDDLRAQLTPSLGAVTRSLGVKLALHKIDRQPPGADKTFVTFQTKVGYALPDDTRNRQRMDAGGQSFATVPLEISLREPICGDARINIAATHELRVSTLNDIIAEKLRALLQQIDRDRYREQDLLDIAVVLLEQRPLDPARIGAFLLEKARARNVVATRAAFHNPEVAARARRDYDALAKTARKRFVPYDDALAAVLAFVDALPIPPE